MTDYKIAVVAVIEQAGQILVGKKEVNADHFLSEVWHIPGGKPEGEETEEQALVREMKEETGLDIKIERFLDEKIIPDFKVRVRWYLCSPLTDELKAGGDLVAVKFVPKAEIFKICDPKAISLWPPKVAEYFKS